MFKRILFFFEVFAVSRYEKVGKHSLFINRNHILKLFMFFDCLCIQIIGYVCL